MATHVLTIAATGTAPNQPTMGFDVTNYEAVEVQVDRLVNLTDYTLQHYALIQDEGGFPAATVWPEMDTLARTKTTGFHISVPLTNRTRYAPRITAWTTAGGPPNSLIITLRFRSA